MSNKSLILKKFNTLFFDFMNEIVTIFPENNDIIQAKTSFEMFKQMNPSIIIKCWYSKIYLPYQNEINNLDVNFFCEKEYNEDLSSLPNSSDIIKIIDSLKNSVRDMSDTNKTHSMKYIQNLSKLSEIYSTI
jgi:hypothetical protein